METNARKKIHIDALDGLRGITVLIVCWYHIWQQSWLSPVINIDLPLIGHRTFSLDVLPRTGYLFVDLMLLLSAFLLFLPYAEAEMLGLPMPDTRTFYRKRAARIIPSYLLAALLLFSYAVFTGSYSTVGAALKDFFATVTFTQTFSAETYIGTHINGVMWTAAVEVAFYLIFPLLAKCFRKQPILTYLGMTAVALVYLKFLVIDREDLIRVSLNQLPAFFGVFANGMMAAWLCVSVEIRLRGKRPWWLMLLSAVAFLTSILVIRYYLYNAGYGQTLQRTQANIRQPMAFAFALLVMSLSLGGKPFRLLFGNRIMRFLGTISYNLYLWHQWIAVRLKEWHIPPWVGEKLPNMAGDRVWQVRYTWLCFGAAFVIATLVTYCFERPLSRILLKKRKRRNSK